MTEKPTKAVAKKAAPKKEAPADEERARDFPEVDPELEKLAGLHQSELDALRELAAQLESLAKVSAENERPAEEAPKPVKKTGKDLYDALAEFNKDFDPENPELWRYQWKRYDDGSVTAVDWATR